MDLQKKLYPEADAKQEYILCAAIHFRDGKTHLHQPVNIETGFVVAGRRHHNCFTTVLILTGMTITEEYNALKVSAVLGFITSKDRFVNRREGGLIAHAAGQIPEAENCLFSDDLY